jgi:hypothetical protein
MRRGDARWLGGFADVVEDLLDDAGIVDEGDGPHLTVAEWATQWQGFIDARQRHPRQIPGHGTIAGLREAALSPTGIKAPVTYTKIADVAKKSGNERTWS